MLGWFQALMPKEERFFELFVQPCHYRGCRCRGITRSAAGRRQIEHYCNQIFERESDADEITRQVLTAVRRTFITPFDRSDIQDL